MAPVKPDARTATAAPVAEYPPWPAALPPEELRSGAYGLSFVRSRDELDRLLELRFRVFNLELGEGLEESYETGRDEDELDAAFHHLLIRHRDTGAVVGTYRMQTSEMAAAHAGYYSAGEFALDGLRPEALAEAVEIGRACVAREHRNGRVLHLLWRGLAAYLRWNRKHLLFGCCSLTSQDSDLGARTYEHLVARGLLHPTLRVSPHPALACAPTGGSSAPVHIPALFDSYLSLGAKICGPPAIDRRFKTIDFLVALDVRDLDARVYRTFFR